MSAAYYNEIDPFAAQWLRELIAAGHIAYGVVDERSIEDVKPNDLKGFTQCHFFAGIGVWSYALRCGGWPDARPVWTGSCPCQPFSSAGKGAGFDDERHLWPAFYHLIAQCRPSVVLGEQVASKATGPWFDLVQADVEALGYAFGCVPFPSAGVGAPHIRDRAYWVADTDLHRRAAEKPRGARKTQDFPSLDWEGELGAGEFGGAGGTLRGVANNQHKQRPIAEGSCDETPRRIEESAEVTGLCCDSWTSQTNGFWGDADWLGCRDGKWRPVEPGTFPLVDGPAARVGRLRGYGNAINAEAAKAFIECL